MTSGVWRKHVRAWGQEAAGRGTMLGRGARQGVATGGCVRSHGQLLGTAEGQDTSVKVDRSPVSQLPPQRGLRSRRAGHTARQPPSVHVRVAVRDRHPRRGRERKGRAGQVRAWGPFEGDEHAVKPPTKTATPLRSHRQGM